MGRRERESRGGRKNTWSLPFYRVLYSCLRPMPPGGWGRQNPSFIFGSVSPTHAHLSPPWWLSHSSHAHWGSVLCASPVPSPYLSRSGQRQWCVFQKPPVPTFCSFQPKLCKGCWVKSMLLAGPATLSNSSLLHHTADPWTGRLRPLSHPWVCDSEGPLMALGPDLLTCELRTGLDSKLR